MPTTPTNGAAPPKKRFAKAGDIIAVHKLLGEVLEPMDDGRFKYKDGLNDDLIGARLGSPHLTGDIVGRLRKQLFGELGTKRPYVRKASSQNDDRLRALEARVEALEKLWS